MPAVTIAPADLAPFAQIPEDKAEAMIADALAMATLVAPCITTAEFAHADAAKAILRGAILRWHESGQGALSQHARTSMGFSESQTFDTRQQRRAMFWPSEIEQLQQMCAPDTDRGAWAYDTVATQAVRHSDECALTFGGEHCSCGAVLLP